MRHSSHHEERHKPGGFLIGKEFSGSFVKIFIISIIIIFGLAYFLGWI
ncbi:hypothetical protein NF867_16535 [Solitalea sp. MAHUQ-68]|uniref:Uncharacterized protein n=1 Tax=Solitalea agri TaxID=2953739 RepID=A0A9X2F532_9SPHI|nr:hypothetical protein [Solitalea agri]MCO4294471.1 hypothetical protein [Solitalea agri]